MPSNKDNSNDQKLGGSRSNGGLGSGEGGNRTHDKGSAHAEASDEVFDTDRNEYERNDGESGQYSNGGGHENQNQETNAESGSTRRSSSERHVGVVSEYGSQSTLRLCGSRNPTVKRWNGYPKVPGHIPWWYATS